MRKIIYWVHTSVDGYIEGPNGEFDWAVPGPGLAGYADGLQERVDTFLYGRTVWEMMSAYWPHADSISDDAHDRAFAPVWRRTPKIVFSRTLTRADWNTRVVGGDLADEVAALKRAPGRDLLLTGGAELAGALTRLGLVDESHIAVHPVLLGGGKPLCGTGKERVALRLVESRTVDGRVVIMRYHRG